MPRVTPGTASRNEARSNAFATQASAVTMPGRSSEVRLLQKKEGVSCSHSR
jgi:hypothetical protein